MKIIIQKRSAKLLIIFVFFVFLRNDLQIVVVYDYICEH